MQLRLVGYLCAQYGYSKQLQNEKHDVPPGSCADHAASVSSL